MKQCIAASSRLALILSAYLLFPCGFTAVAQVSDARVDGLETRIASLENRFSNVTSKLSDRGSLASLGFLFGGFCALWAQNTRRNPWLWFFLGLLFSVGTVIVLLFKNSQDRKEGPSHRAP